MGEEDVAVAEEDEDEGDDCCAGLKSGHASDD